MQLGILDTGFVHELKLLGVLHKGAPVVADSIDDDQGVCLAHCLELLPAVVDGNEGACAADAGRAVHSHGHALVLGHPLVNRVE